MNIKSRKTKRRGMTKREEVLVALLRGNTAERQLSGSWKWQMKFDGAPSLANQYVAPLFLADYVTQVGKLLKLTAMGMIKAKKLVTADPSNAGGTINQKQNVETNMKSKAKKRPTTLAQTRQHRSDTTQQRGCQRSDDVWLPLQETQRILIQSGIVRSDDKVRAMADNGTLPAKRLENGERRFSLLGLQTHIKGAAPKRNAVDDKVGSELLCDALTNIRRAVEGQSALTENMLTTLYSIHKLTQHHLHRALTTEQLSAAHRLRYERPATIEGTNCVPDDAERAEWNSKVCAAIRGLSINDPLPTAVFCDIAGVAE